MQRTLTVRFKLVPFTDETLSGFPFKRAPWPLRASKNCPKTGLVIIPICGSLLTSKAMDTQTWGKEWTKFMVPSTGSMTHVGSSVSSCLFPSAVDSSPMNLQIKIIRELYKFVCILLLMVWELLVQSCNQQFLNLLISFGDQVNFAALLLYSFGWTNSIFDELY